MKGREEFHPKSTQEVVVMRWGEMEKKVGENGRGDGDENGNTEDLRWNLMEMEEGWVGLRDFWVNPSIATLFSCKWGLERGLGVLESLYRCRNPKFTNLIFCCRMGPRWRPWAPPGRQCVARHCSCAPVRPQGPGGAPNRTLFFLQIFLNSSFSYCFLLLEHCFHHIFGFSLKCIFSLIYKRLRLEVASQSS